MYARFVKGSDAPVGGPSDPSGDCEIRLGRIQEVLALLAGFTPHLPAQAADLVNDLTEQVAQALEVSQTSRQLCYQLSSEILGATLMSALPEDERMFGDIESAARISFRQHRGRVRGQVLTRYDNADAHLISAALQWAARNPNANPHAAPAQDRQDCSLQSALPLAADASVPNDKPLRNVLQALLVQYGMVLRIAKAKEDVRHDDKGEPAVNVPKGMERDHLRWMVNEALKHFMTWPIDKTSRWVGFIQAAMVLHGLTTVKAERDFSRPLFHAAYQRMGLSVPATAEPGASA